MVKAPRGILALVFWLSVQFVAAVPAAHAAPQYQGYSAPAASVTTPDMIARAQQLLGIKYKWGGATTAGLDCSAYLSLVWNVPRQTTDTLASVAYPIAKADLAPGDAMNLTTVVDPHHRGHVRLFAGWADPGEDWMWVYEEARPISSYHMIPYNPVYTPMRRDNYQPSDSSKITPPLLPATPIDITDPRVPYSLET